MKTYILYTTSRIDTYQKRADAVAAEWSKTKGRGEVKIILERVKPKPPKIAKDLDGDSVIDWPWFNKIYLKKDYDGVIYHFTPHYRQLWKISEHINGSRNALNKEYPEFWICCDGIKMASGYEGLGEFERLLFHEHAHYDEDQDDAVGNILTQDSVHKTDYELKKIHLYHLLVDYRGKAIKEAVNNVIISVIKLAKKYI